MSPSESELRYVIIGAGMSGILAGVKFLEKGIKNFAIYEKADRVGGTWRENTYPGITCDVPSHSYTYSFALNPDWTRTLPPGSEVQAYFEGVVKRYGLENWIRYGQEVTECSFDSGRWNIRTAAGVSDSAHVVVAATGVLHHPRYPNIAGMDTFEGALFHSARWDHSVPLDGRRIAVIGTGSTGVQIVSALSKRAERVVHFQRTPQWILPVEDRPFSREEIEAFRSDPDVLRAQHYDAEIEAGIERFTAAITDPSSPAMKEIDAIVLANLEDNVRDPGLRERIRPNYRPACKRLIYSADFYEAVQRSSVEVVVEGVTAIEPGGIRTGDGVLRELDVIVLATGFRTDQFMRPMSIVGRGERTLEEEWEDKPAAYMAVAMPDFPNLFMLNGPNGPVGNFSLIEIAECQWNYIEQLIELLRGGECTEISPTRAAFEAFESARLEAAKGTIFATGCKSWYLDKNGVPSTWPWTRSRFKQEMLSVKLDCYDIRSGNPP